MISKALTKVLKQLYKAHGIIAPKYEIGDYIYYLDYWDRIPGKVIGISYKGKVTIKVNGLDGKRS